MSKSDVVLRELKRSAGPRSDRKLHLAHFRLFSVPTTVLSPTFESLLRLDISHNRITYLDPEISHLKNLKELWISYNPIKTIPQEISACLHLEVLLLCKTDISELPFEMALLTKLHTLDWRDTPLATKVTSLESDEEMKCGFAEYKLMLQEGNKRSVLKERLIASLSVGHFAQDILFPGFDSIICTLVEDTSLVFKDLHDFAMFCKQADRLLPDRVAKITSQTPAEVFHKLKDMQTEVTKQRLSAEVDIKLRCFYYDRISREDCLALIADLYKHIRALQDLQFFVKHAHELLPPEAAQASGAAVWVEVLRLQESLAAQRLASVDSLFDAIAAQYPEQERQVLRTTAEQLAAVYQKNERFTSKVELSKMAFLTSEVSQLFPQDFSSIKVKAVIDKANEMSRNRGK